MNELIEEIIPPLNHSHRNGFSNYHIIDSLNKDEKFSVEKELISMLKDSNDWLIGETLAYMKSKDSIPLLKNKLKLANDSITKIQWANSIFKIDNHDKEMLIIAYEEFKKISDKWSLISIFYTLVEFEDDRINEKIKSYQTNPDYLIAYNALQSLGLNTADLVNKERLKNDVSFNRKKAWWKFW